ncbi:MAG TPA: pyridoxal phosphate-dependent aminotransferase [Streptosporangiaceae bacterium]|nr:pyridoxal phosphate-dependent aminotransferase [Streptosporangiaceae bacterium]
MPFAGTATAASPTLPLSIPALAPAPPPAPPARPPAREHLPVSATLAANEALAARRRRGQPVLPLAFGEAGLPAHPALRDALAAATASNGYGPVAGLEALRSAAAGYWQRRGLPTSPGSVVCGPGSKPLLFGLLLAADADVAVPRPSWVSYAAQASLIGARAHFVAAAPGEGGICDPAALRRAVTAARAAGREIRSVVVTLPDNPTGRVPRPATVRAFCAAAAELDLIIISDEIYRDLVHDPTTPVLSPAAVAPERTVVTTALSKSLALGGWRIGVARLPEGRLGDWLRGQLVGIGSEIWSAPAVPIQRAAAVAFSEPEDLAKRIVASRALHAAVSRAVAGICVRAGLDVPPPQAAFYVYPDFEPWRGHLARRHGVTTAAGLAGLLLERYGAGTLPGSAFGESAGALRLRLATGSLYGDTDDEQEAALDAAGPLALPWIAGHLDRLEEILADLAP